MSAKTILIAHRHAAIRDRFAAALADARHAFVLADRADAVFQTFVSSPEPISLALVDLGLAEDGVAFVHALRRSAGRALPIVVFAGTVSSAGQVPALLALRDRGAWHPDAAVVSSLLLPSALLTASAWRLSRTDY